MGFTEDAGSLTDCTFNFTGTIQETTDGVGVQSAHGFSGGMGTLTANFVRCPDETPAWTLTLSGLTQVAAPSESEPNAAYHTATATAEIVIERDADS